MITALEKKRKSNKYDKDQNSELNEKLVAVNRVAKVVKGGRRFRFSALMVVGDTKGHVGFGSGKAKEVPEAVRKATESAKKHMRFIPLREVRTVHHDTKGHFGAGRVVVRSAPPGTGIIAGGAMRAIFESLGVQDVVAKSVGSSNPYNIIRATMNALFATQSPRTVADRRSKKVSDIVKSRSSVANVKK